MSSSVALSEPKGKNHGFLEQLFSHADVVLNGRHRRDFRVLPVSPILPEPSNPALSGRPVTPPPVFFPGRQTFKLGKNIYGRRTMP